MRRLFLVSEWFYGVLLHLYPKRFRAVHSQQMRLTFRDACRVAYRRNGIGGLLTLWLPTLLDLFKSVLEERARKGEITMVKARLITLAPPLTILVGMMWLVVAIGTFVPLTSDETLIVLWSYPFFLSFIPMLFAIIGTRFRYQQSAVGRFGLALSVVGCAGVIVFVLAAILSGVATSGIDQAPWVNYAAVACILSIRIGYILFGIEVLHHRLLPRWNLLPLLLGSTLVLSLPLDWFGVPAFLSLPSQLNIPLLHFAITGACWVLLGMALIDQKREPELEAAPPIPANE